MKPGCSTRPRADAARPVEVLKAGGTSVAVKVETWARGRGRGREPEKVTEGVFTFVAIDEHGRPREVPGDDGG